MVDPLSFDFVAGAALGAVAIAPSGYFGFRMFRKWLTRRRAGIRQTAHAPLVGRRRRRAAPTNPVLADAVQNMETRLAVTWEEFRRRHLTGGM